MKWGYSSLSVLRFLFSPLLLGPVLPESCSTWTLLHGKACRRGWAQGHWVTAPCHHPCSSSSCPAFMICWPWPSGHRSHGHMLLWQHFSKKLDSLFPCIFNSRPFSWETLPSVCLIHASTSPWKEQLWWCFWLKLTSLCSLNHMWRDEYSGSILGWADQHVDDSFGIQCPYFPSWDLTTFL